ncbi:hypothetical protein [Cupriavidus basilensis]|uniref:hypothetical protein n=1 Tax=Cupriavidus basilensis TaxID=68895 RepID=UPI00075197B9|nr:hypothetical protein [Cupriavidus basilensis]
MTALVSLADYGGTPQQLEGQFIPTKFAAVTLNSASGTTPQNMLVVPADKYVFVTGIQITIDPIATLGAAGMELISIADSVDGNIATLRAYIPALAASPTIPTVIRQTSAPGAFWASSQKGTTIAASLSVALTAASVRISFHYGFTNKLIGNN